MIRKQSNLILIRLFMLFSLAGCAVYNTDLDRKIGAENAQQVAQQFGLYQQPPLAEYIEEVGQRLVAQLDSPQFTFQFHIIDDPTPNAFALPGGYIYISRGLLALMINEDELANVLAHEIIHVTERHSIKQMRSGILPSLIELPGSIVGIVNEKLGNLINAPISAGNDLFLSGYSRAHESESDEKGITLAAKAGYEPLQMANILTRLNSAVELSTQQKQQKSYFASHPYTPDRVANINKFVKELEVKVSPSYVHQSYLSAVDELLFAENPAKGIFLGSTFVHPELGFVIDFPGKWSLLNQPQAVVAYDEKQNSFIALSVVNNERNALQTAQFFQQQVSKKSDTLVNYQTVSFEWGGLGYLISFDAKRHKQSSTITLLWVDFAGLTYQISSMASTTFKSQLTQSHLSFRPINETEKAAITKQNIHIVKAKQGDTLITLAEREKNQAEISYIALINSLDKKQILSDQQLVKIVIASPYNH